MNQRFEYDVTRVREDTGQLKSALNEKAAEGWRLIQVMEEDGFVMIFERERSQ